MHLVSASGLEKWNALRDAQIGLALFTGSLGDDVVDRMGVGVDDGAHDEAASSLAKRRVGV